MSKKMYKFLEKKIFYKKIKNLLKELILQKIGWFDKNLVSKIFLLKTNFFDFSENKIFYKKFKNILKYLTLKKTGGFEFLFIEI